MLKIKIFLNISTDSIFSFRNVLLLWKKIKKSKDFNVTMNNVIGVWSCQGYDRIPFRGGWAFRALAIYEAESYRLISATDFILHNLSCLISAVVGLFLSFFLSFFLSSRTKCSADSRRLQQTRASEEGKNSIDETLLPSYLYTIHSKDIGSAPTCVPQYQISVQKESLRESARERVSETKWERKSQTLCETEREK